MDNTRMRMYNWIIEYKQEHNGCSPSIEEIGEALKLSKSNVTYHLDMLEDAGLIWREYGVARSICVSDSAWVYQFRIR
jgi:DNA-binding MarR family transcriptional regulator